MIEILCFIGTKTRVSKKQDEIMDLFGIPAMEAIDGVSGILTGRLIELLVFLWAKPWPVRYIALRLIGR